MVKEGQPDIDDKKSPEEIRYDEKLDASYQNSVSIFNFFQNLRNNISIVLLTYVKLIWIICMFIIIYHIIIRPLYKLFGYFTCLRKTLDYSIGKDAALLPVGFLNRLLWLIEPSPVLIAACIIFTVITCVMIFAYILFLIALFIYSLPIIGAMIGNPREWEDFKRLRDVFDLFEGKISPLRFIKICLFESIVVLFFSKNTKESFGDYSSKIAPQSLIQLEEVMERRTYIPSELDKSYYSSAKYFYENKDDYNVESIKALNHTIEANIINNTIITAYKENYNKNLVRNKYSNNGFEEGIKNIIPI
jgi:hypothetical protein